MQYFILSLSSLNNTFSIFESGSQIKFKYHYFFKELGDLNQIFIGDFILGYKRGVNIIKYVFKVVNIDSKNNELILEKVLECTDGVSIDDWEIIENFEREEIVEIDEPNFIKIYNNLLNNLDIFNNDDDSTDETNTEVNDDLESQRICCGKNTIIYGVPGVGKSWTIKDVKCKGIKERFIERVVFHPDYTYSDFIGQILPNVEEGDIDYKFTPGPFTNILKTAYKNPSEKVFLIIEEINRGNAPAIFGDIFQLLDRMKKPADGFKIGTSEFGVTNPEIAKEVYGEKNKERKIRIPSNLNIIATMNTSDQNVFTLDTAFKRRWHMEMIENDFSKPSFKNKEVPNSKITWEVFGTAINEIILEESKSTLSSEDKRLGAYFVDEEDLKDAKEFAEKVLMYLWDDVFKFSRENYFDEESVDQFCLESFIKKFVDTKEKDQFTIFTAPINNKIKEVKERLPNGKEENGQE